MANEMRDRLVELMNFVQCKAECCSALDGGRCGDLDNLYRCQIETIADHLIENGVIVPPCKIGDTVYAIWKDEVLKAKVGNIHITTHKERTTMWLGVSIRVKNNAFTFSSDLLFGCFVFLTEAEAEQKLKEMRDGNGSL